MKAADSIQNARDTALLDALDKWARKHGRAFQVGEETEESNGGIVTGWSAAKAGGVRAVIREFLQREGVEL